MPALGAPATQPCAAEARAAVRYQALHSHKSSTPLTHKHAKESDKSWSSCAIAKIHACASLLGCSITCMFYQAGRALRTAPAAQQAAQQHSCRRAAARRRCRTCASRRPAAVTQGPGSPGWGCVPLRGWARPRGLTQIADPIAACKSGVVSYYGWHSRKHGGLDYAGQAEP